MLDSNYLFVNEIDSSAIEDRGRRSNFKTLVDGEDHMVELKGVDLEEADGAQDIGFISNLLTDPS